MFSKKKGNRDKKLISNNISRRNFISNLEKSKTPPLFYVLFFIIAVSIRFILEVYLSHYSDNIFDALGYFHMILFYLTIVASTTILLSFFIKENFANILKLILPFIFIINISPLIDFFLSGGRGLKMTYLFNSENYLLKFLTIGGEEITKGLTIGLRIEIIIFLILFFYYLQVKKKEHIINAVKTFIFYSIIFFYLSAPIFLEPILQFFEISMKNNWIYVINSYFTILFLINLIIIFFILKKEILYKIFLDVRLGRLIHFIGMFFLGILISLKIGQINLAQDFFTTLMFTPLAITGAWIFSVMENNIHDIKIDQISNKKRPLQKGININEYSFFSKVFFGLSIIFACSGGIISLSGIIIFIALYYIYSTPPFRVKRIPLLSKGIISFASLTLIYIGYLATGGNILEFPLEIMLVFVIGFTLAINFIDIKDYEGDKKNNILTLPVIFGLKKSKIIIGIFFIIAYLIAYLAIRKEVLLPIVLIFAILEFLFINSKEYSEKNVFIIYLISLIIIGYFYFF